MKEHGVLKKSGEARLEEVNRQIGATEAALRALHSLE